MFNTSTSNPLPVRTRSIRVPATANSSRSIATAATAATAAAASATTAASSKKPSTKTTSQPQSQPSSQTPTAPSNISLFLTNLLLLDLDLHPDWPAISALTFTAVNRDATQGQGQKRRIQCVEWALYQLFSLWDPDEARDKLRPFFPPLDQVQSTNLRAALLRCLDRAKKNGVLGRDVVLRKTMLDECKGERLEEILAVFSSAVLKKVVAEQHKDGEGGPPALAQTLALEQRGYAGERDELDSLILAHRVSLARKLDRKRASSTQYGHFAGLLDAKERAIVGRREHIRAVASAQNGTLDVSDSDKADVRRAVRNNWSGNERWMEALLYGDARSRKDGVLTAPFERVWRRVRSGRLDELEDESSGGLLDQLEGRVRVQQERLGKWQKFQKEMFGNVVESTGSNADKLGRRRGIDLGFGAHEALQLGTSRSMNLAGATSPRLEGTYGRLLDGLKAELEDIGRGSAAPSFGHMRRRAQPPKPSAQGSPGEMVAEEPVSELSELEEELEKTYVPLSRRPLSISSRYEPEASTAPFAPEKRPQRMARARLPLPLSTMHPFKSEASSAETSPIESAPQQLPPPPHSPSPRRSPPLRGATRSPPRLPSAPRAPTPEEEEKPPSPTQHQADQILASMNAASPSPMKQQARPRHTLSLAERTRLSLARNPGAVDLDDDDDDDLGIGSSTRLRRRNTTSRSPTKRSKPTTPMTETADVVAGHRQDRDREKGPAQQAKVQAEEDDDLVARTRRSMANFEATQQKVRLERERAQRRSARQQSLSNKSGEIARQTYFPTMREVDEWDGADGGGQQENSTMVLEELMAKAAEGEEADYESVFMSRPKIKASPPGSPGLAARGTW